MEHAPKALSFELPAILGCVLLIVAIALLVYARRADAKNWLYARSPLLPLRLVRPRDDAWVRGVVDLDTPLRIPHFDDACAYYDYRLEEQRTRTVRTKNGSRTETYWATLEHETEGVPFRLVADGNAIEIDPTQAELDALAETGFDHDGRLRHTAAYLPVAVPAFALGCVAEDAKHLEAFANIPLLVTLRTRDEFVRSAESSERVGRGFGFAFLLAALCTLAFAMSLQTHPLGPYESSEFPRVLASIAIGCGATLIVWILHAYNTLVAYRTRTLAAWRHIDVDLKQRFELVPSLVTVLSALAAHEKTTLESLATLRNQLDGASAHRTIATEAKFRDAIERCVVLVEKYPALRSNANFQRLHDQLVALEDKIAHDRTFFDDCATEFNTVIETFPRSLLAAAFRFEPWPLFKAQ